MRIDARNLLDRLGRNDFAYREFEDRFSELELWPMFEALLRDPRMQTLDLHEAAATAAPAAAPSSSDAPDGTPGDDAFGALFRRYERTESATGTADRRGMQAQDVRAMLRHLSDLGSQGKI